MILKKALQYAIRGVKGISFKKTMFVFAEAGNSVQIPSEQKAFVTTRSNTNKLNDKREENMFMWEIFTQTSSTEVFQIVCKTACFWHVCIKVCYVPTTQYLMVSSSTMLAWFLLTIGVASYLGLISWHTTFLRDV